MNAPVEGVWTRTLALSRQTALYGAGRIIPRLLGVVMLAVYTRYLTPSDFGTVAAVTLVTALAADGFRLSQDAALLRLYYDARIDPHRLRGLLGSVFFLMLTVPIGGAVVLSLAGLIPLRRLLPEIGAEPLGWGIATAAALCLPTVGLMLCRVREQARFYSMAQVGHSVVTHAFTLYFLVGLGQGAVGQLKGVFLGWLALFLVFAWVFSREAPPRPHAKDLSETLRYGIPLLPEAVAGWIVKGSDRFFLIAAGGLTAAGVYALGATVAGAVMVVIFSAYQAFGPFYFSAAAERERAARLVPPIVTYYLVATSVVVLAVSLFARELVGLVAPAHYAGAAAVVPILASAHLFYPLIHAGGCAILFRKRSSLYVGLVLGAAALNLALNAALIPRFGAIGAAAASWMTFVPHACAALFVGQRLFRLPYEARRIAWVLGLTIGLQALGATFDSGSTWPNLAMKAGLLACHPLLLWATGFFRAGERARVRGLFSRVRPALQ